MRLRGCSSESCRETWRDNVCARAKTGGARVVSVQPAVGDTVKWAWGDGLHNVVSGGNCTTGGALTSDTLTSDTSFTFSRTFDRAGSFDYYWDVHCTVGMTGKVVVQ